jgi:hypothetical protein
MLTNTPSTLLRAVCAVAVFLLFALHAAVAPFIWPQPRQSHGKNSPPLSFANSSSIVASWLLRGPLADRAADGGNATQSCAERVRDSFKCSEEGCEDLTAGLSEL